MTTYAYTGKKSKQSNSQVSSNGNAIIIILLVIIIAAAGLYYLIDMRYRTLISRLDNINSRQAILDNKMAKLEERIKEKLRKNKMLL